MHPTRKILIDTVSELLKVYGPDDINGQMVLRKCGVSHGSLYHHFEDASDLIETAMLNKFSEGITADIEALAEAVTQAPDRATFLAMIHAVSGVAQQPKRNTDRMQRVHLLSYAASRPRFMHRMGQNQTQLSSSLADLIVIAQSRGWVAKQIDPLAAAVFFQAFTLGRVIDDVSSKTMSPDKWAEIVRMTIERILHD